MSLAVPVPDRLHLFDSNQPAASCRFEHPVEFRKKSVDFFRRVDDFHYNRQVGRKVEYLGRAQVTSGAKRHLSAP